MKTFLLLMLVTLNVSAATFYVRPDGGSAAQCTGLADAAVTSTRACAWSSPLVALPSGEVARIAPGDTLRVARGTYRIGFGTPGAEKCSSHYPWDCINTRIPNGAKILGDCAVRPKLIGVERAQAVLALGDSSNVEVACLEITDGQACGELLGDAPCKRDIFPFGHWASNGITARGAKSVVLRELHIHGLAGRGLSAGGIADWTLINVRIVGNAWAGWDGDIGSGSSNAGAITFNGGEIAWNGCIETLTGAPGRCYAQMQGGYGDGLGTAATGGAWSFVGVNVHHNTSDGIDLLYAEGGSVTVRNSTFASNAGNQLKTKGAATIESNRIAGDCGWFARNTLELVPGDHCRAAGNSLSLTIPAGAAVTLTNNDISGEGDCLVIADGPGTLAASGNRFVAGPQYGGGDTTCGYYAQGGTISTWTANTWSATKAGTAPANAAGIPPPAPTAPGKVEIPAQAGKKLVCEWVDAA